MNTSFYGRLTRDPEIRTSQNGGNPYTTITVATQVRSKDKDGKNIKCKRQAVHKRSHRMQHSI